MSIMMKTRFLITIFIVAILISGCNSYVLPRKSNHTETPVARISTQTLINATPAQQTMATDNCVIEYPERPKDYQLSGVVGVRSLSTEIQGLSLSILALKDDTQINIDTSNQSVWEAEISPDGHGLAYKWFNDKTSKWEVVLIGSDGSNKKLVWSSEEDFSLLDWVNNHQILLLVNSAYTIVGINQNIKEIVIPFDFPGFDAYDFPTHFSVVFDSSLSKVVYKNAKINLLDLATNTIIAQIPDAYDRSPIVDWAPESQLAAVVSSNIIEPINNISSDEIFIFEQNGNIRQLTNLLESFNAGRTIDSLGWSPDEEKIAFWLHNGEGYQSLMIVDVSTGETTNYCITSLVIDDFPVDLSAPIWLPDGNRLLVESRYARDKSKLLVVDLSMGIAFPIAENSNPIGWMAEINN